LACSRSPRRRDDDDADADDGDDAFPRAWSLAGQREGKGRSRSAESWLAGES
jgi:hypothetical protein